MIEERGQVRLDVDLFAHIFGMIAIVVDASCRVAGVVLVHDGGKSHSAAIRGARRQTRSRTTQTSVEPARTSTASVR